MKNMIFMLVIAMSISFLFGAFSKEDAINLVLNDILKDELNLIDVYVKADSMCASGTLHLLNEVPISPPYSGNWVFFVDDMPGAHWHHPAVTFSSQQAMALNRNSLKVSTLMASKPNLI